MLMEISGAVAILLGLVFAALCVFVASGRSATWDRRMLARVGRLRPAPAKVKRWTVIHDLSALGGDTLRGIALAVAALMLALSGRPAAAAGLLLMFAGARLALIVIKSLVPRVRPDADGHHTKVHTASFPSGHTMMTLVLWLGLALIAVAPGPAQWAAVALALLAGGVVGLVRLILAVHWPTDVLAGWIAGVLWVMGCLLIWPAA